MTNTYLYNPIVTSFDYGMAHPFRLERLWLTHYLISELGLFGEEDELWSSFEPAERDDLLPAHGPEYLDVLELASMGVPAPVLGSYGLSSGDNPIFPNLWEYCAFTAGGSLRGAHLLQNGEAERVFHPGGGLHHAFPHRASGFCYVNDVVLAIDKLREGGQRVLYVDIDAHHGDAVEAAFADKSEVMTISVHQDGRTLFPGSGFATDIGRGDGLGYAVNIGLLPHSGDADYERVFDEIIEPLHRHFAPDVIVTELGADALVGDPLTNLALTLPGWWNLLGRFSSWQRPWLAVGGGGYDLANAMRAWALAWAVMTGSPRPDHLPAAPAELPGVAAEMDWPDDFWGAPGGISGYGGDEEATGVIVAQVKNEVFPIHGL